MLTLIEREIKDHLAFFLGAVIAAAILAALLVSTVRTYSPFRDLLIYAVWLLVPAILTLVIAAFGMGASQMYTDRARKVSAFLSALPVTRSRILLARITTGMLAMLTFLIPLAIVSAILLRLFPLPFPIYHVFHDLFSEVLMASFLMAFACYCLGLFTGWTSNKIIPTLGGLSLTMVLVTLILVKGFGADTSAILVLVIMASLARTWQKFTSTAL